MNRVVVRCFIAFALTFFLACEARSQQSDEWLIVAGERFGSVSDTTSEADLFRSMGEGEVVRDSIGVGEGYCVPGTVLYPDSPDRVEIVWTDSTRERPAYLRIWHVRDSTSKWKTREGIHLGMSIEDLETLNGKPFSFSGFGWDYGGGVGSMEGGRLAESFEKGLHLALMTNRDSLHAISNDDRASEIFGDRLVRSDHPLVRRAGVQVAMISLRFARADPEAEVFCG